MCGLGVKNEALQMLPHQKYWLQKFYKKIFSHFDRHVLVIKRPFVGPLLIHLSYEADNIRLPRPLIS